MAISPGVRLGPYEIVALLGAGGMGEVYRARDTQLGREVALKVLPELFVTDPERVARFQREAKTLAVLSHPNIGAIYGLEQSNGITALVLELVEGPTLADRLARGSLPLDEALPIGQQIASALEAAHDHGIIHRDLKPSNIKVRPDGTVKVLDFGLAKAQPTDAAAPVSDVSHLLTVTSPAATRAGVILGTAAYMSPEQARGKPLDKRTDIWAFGCVLYEMLTGRRAFTGDDVSEVLASVLAREPDFAALPATTPPPIRRLVQRCLQKDRTDRLRDIGDARIEIRDAQSKTDSEAIARGGDRGSRQRIVLTASLALVALIAVVAIVWRFQPEPGAPEVRLDINTPQTSAPASVAISPDGRTMAFVATADGQSRLWLRPLDSAVARPLRGTDGARYPFWSPDSRSIGFFADNKLQRIDIDGESIRILSNAHRGTGGAWNRDGVIVFSSLGAPVSRVPEGGGEPIEMPRLVQLGSNFSPHFLPDGRHFLYYVRAGPEARGVYVGQLDGASPSKRVLDSDAGAVYAPSGHLMFVRQGTLFAQVFDASTWELGEPPSAVAQNVANCPCVSVSNGGAIAYRPAGPPARRQFVWFDRSGAEISKVSDVPAMSTPSLSPDGQRILGYRGLSGNVDVWLFDIRRGAYERLTSDVSDDVTPVWSPSGDHIVFASNRKGPHDLYRRSAAAGGTEELLLASGAQKFPTDWSSDGRFVLFETQNATTSSDLWVMPMDGSGKPVPVAETKFDEQRGQLSPAGAWVAYQSDESGRDEIYIQRFPGPATSKWTVSTNSGTQVRWRRDGKELFYVALDGRLMAVPIQVSANEKAPEVGAPIALFSPPLGGMVQQADFRHQYSVSPDGQRFLVAAVTEPANVPIVVILNWKPKS
jgi:serine/threonine protein kinase/Tol biopolymer transport system component